MGGWTLSKIAPNLTNILRKLFETRMVKTPRSVFYKGTPINKWPKDGPSIVPQKIPVRFSKQGKPFEQTYRWDRPLGQIEYKAATLKRGAAKFLPSQAKVGPSIALEKVKGAGKLGIVGVTGTALGYASTQRKSPKAGISTPRVQKKDIWRGPPSGKFGKAEKRVSVPVSSGKFGSGKGLRMQTKPTKVSSKVITRPSIDSYKAVPKTKVPVAKVAKTPKVSTPVRKMASTSRSMDGPKKVSSTVETTAASRKAAAAGILTAKIIRKFGITPEQVRASDVSQKKRLLAYRGGTIAGPKKTTEFKSPFAGDIKRKQASGYHIFKKDSAGAVDFRRAHKAAKGKKFKWKGTGKWYSGA